LAAVRDGRLTLTGLAAPEGVTDGADDLDPLRVLCSAAWATGVVDVIASDGAATDQLRALGLA
jgi:hypothetical protein